MTSEERFRQGSSTSDFPANTRLGKFIASEDTIGSVVRKLGLPLPQEQALLTGGQVLDMILEGKGETTEAAETGSCGCLHEVDYKVPGSGCGCSGPTNARRVDPLDWSTPGMTPNDRPPFITDGGCYLPVWDPKKLLAHFGHHLGAGGGAGAGTGGAGETNGVPINVTPLAPYFEPTGVVTIAPQEPPFDCCCCALTLEPADHPEVPAAFKKKGKEAHKIVQGWYTEEGDPAQTAISYFSVKGTFENKKDYKEKGRCYVEWWEWTDNAKGNPVMEAFGFKASSPTMNNFTEKAKEISKELKDKEIPKEDKATQDKKHYADSISGSRTCGGPCPGPGSIVVSDNPSIPSTIGNRILLIAVRMRHGGVCKDPCKAEPEPVWFMQVVEWAGIAPKKFDAGFHKHKDVPKFAKDLLPPPK